jgi:hypothetical protein
LSDEKVSVEVAERFRHLGAAPSPGLAFNGHRRTQRVLFCAIFGWKLLAAGSLYPRVDSDATILSHYIGELNRRKTRLALLPERSRWPAAFPVGLVQTNHRE